MASSRVSVGDELLSSEHSFDGMGESVVFEGPTEATAMNMPIITSSTELPQPEESSKLLASLFVAENPTLSNIKDSIATPSFYTDSSSSMMCGVGASGALEETALPIAEAQQDTTTNLLEDVARMVQEEDSAAISDLKIEKQKLEQELLLLQRQYDSATSAAEEKSAEWCKLFEQLREQVASLEKKIYKEREKCNAQISELNEQLKTLQDKNTELERNNVLLNMQLEEEKFKCLEAEAKNFALEVENFSIKADRDRFKVRYDELKVKLERPNSARQS